VKTKDKIIIIINQFVVWVSKQNSLNLLFRSISEHLSGSVKIKFKKSESYLLTIFTKEYKDHKDSDMNATPNIARKNFIIIYFIVSKILLLL